MLAVRIAFLLVTPDRGERMGIAAADCEGQVQPEHMLYYAQQTESALLQ